MCRLVAAFYVLPRAPGSLDGPQSAQAGRLPSRRYLLCPVAVYDTDLVVPTLLAQRGEPR